LVGVEAPEATRRSPLAVTVDLGIALATLKDEGDMTVAISLTTRAVRPVMVVPVVAT
jgi:hypothetical protein